MTHLQDLSHKKPLRARTARWLDFLAEFSDLTITYLQGSSNRVADALSRHPHHPAERTNSAALALCAATLRYFTRGQRRDYRADAGIRPQRPLRPTTTHSPPPTALPPPTPVSSSSSPSPNPSFPSQNSSDPPSLTDVAPLSPTAWETAYSKCKEFAAPFASAQPHAGDAVQLDFHNRRHAVSSRHICISAFMVYGEFVSQLCPNS